MRFFKSIFGRKSSGETSSKSCMQYISRVGKSTTAEQNTDIISLSEKYSYLDEEELFSFLEEKELSGEELAIEEKQFLEEQGWAQLARTLRREDIYGRSLAIKALLNNSYEILNKEYGNPLKEPINFTLLYFKNYFKDKPVDANNLLIGAFPLMHHFIYRQISKQNNNIPVVSNFDEQKAYDEFLIFCKNVFLSLYPDKDNRDRQIRLFFKVLDNDLINFIEIE